MRTNAVDHRKNLTSIIHVYPIASTDEFIRFVPHKCGIMAQTPKASRRALITDTSVARLAFAKDEAGYVVRDRDVRGFIVKVGMRRKTYRYEGEQRNGNHRKVISRKLGEYPHTRAGDARSAALDIIGQRARGE